MSFDLDSLSAAVAAHGAVIRVVIAETRGSVPRGPGAAMLVWADGQSGTIGGGALELAASTAARVQLANRVGTRISRHALGPALAQCCGGAVTLVSELWDAARIAVLAQGPVVLRQVEGSGDLPFALRGAFREARGAGQPLGLSFSGGWLAEPVTRAARPVWIHGAGHVGRALVATLAPLPDIALTWTDTGPERFPDAVPDGVSVLPGRDPSLLVRRAPHAAEHFVMTYSHDLDLRLCDALLRHGFGRAGLIGSATKWARFRSRLAALGHGPDAIARITCPIGAPALGKAPQQIAIGVAHRLLAEGAPSRAALPARRDTA